MKKLLVVFMGLCVIGALSGISSAQMVMNGSVGQGQQLHVINQTNNQGNCKINYQEREQLREVKMQKMQALHEQMQQLRQQMEQLRQQMQQLNGQMMFVHEQMRQVMASR